MQVSKKPTAVWQTFWGAFHEKLKGMPIDSFHLTVLCFYLVSSLPTPTSFSLNFIKKIREPRNTVHSSGLEQ